MENRLLEVKYYVKRNGEVKRITEKEYKELLKEIKAEGKSYICPNCKVCTCEKIRYTDITRCEEVDFGLFVLKKHEFSGESKTLITKDKTFQVFECREFQPFKEIEIQQEIEIKNEILELDRRILELETDGNSLENNVKIQKLLKLRKTKLQNIHEKEILKNLEIESRKQKTNFLNNKTLKLENKS